MNEHFKHYGGINFVSYLYDLEEFIAGHFFVLLVGIYNEYEGAALAQGHYILRVLFAKFLISWEIFNLELDIWVDVGL